MSRRLQLIGCAFGVVLLASACTDTPDNGALPGLSGASPSASGNTPAPTPQAGAASAQSSSSASVVPSSGGSWATPTTAAPLKSSGYLSGQQPAAVLEVVELARHPEASPAYTRVTFRFRGVAPGYRVNYAAKVVAPSGQTVLQAGSTQGVLDISFHAAQGHNDSGASTIQPLRGSGIPIVTGLKRYEDFEGYIGYGAAIQVAAGSDQTRAVRVGQTASSGYYNIYIDIQS